MQVRFLWGIVVLGTICYLNCDLFNRWDTNLRESFSLTSNVKNDLSLIPTSPRWRNPFGNYNSIQKEDKSYKFMSSKLPIISLEIEKDDFFSYSKGIYIIGKEEWAAKKSALKWWQFPANYKNRGKEWEREATISFINFDEKIPSQKIGVRINGNATRAFPQKSLRLVFSANPISNFFFNKNAEVKFHTLLLRNGGNDWDRAFMRDVVCQKLSEEMACETQNGIAVNLYLNGEYWGIHYLRPKIDHEYIAERYQLDAAHISIIESPLQIYRGDSSGLDDFKDLVKLSKTNWTNDSIQFAQYEAKMNINSFIDYVIIQSFIANTDWPQNNWMVWKDITSDNKHGKWKWILKDTDYGLGFYSKNAFNVDMIKKIAKSKGAISTIYNALSSNTIFKNRLDVQFNKFLKTNWNEANFIQTLDSMKTLLAPNMEAQMNRWRTHNSMNDWIYEVDQLYTFYNKRIEYYMDNKVVHNRD